MEHWEQELREALRRQDAPAGFAARLEQHLAQQERRAWWARPGWTLSLRVAGTLAFCLLLVAGGVLYRQQQRERVAGAKAKQEVLLALRIANAKLQLTAHKVQKVAER